jgi:hypothetical protein
MRFGAGVAMVALVGCQSGPRLQTPSASVSPDAAIEATVYLIGDAGGADPGDQVLGALAAELRQRSDNTTVVFLGDNVYPRGIPPADDPGRAEAERRLLVQVDMLRGTGARGVFVPGNHDWAHSGVDGWASVLRQDSIIDAQGIEGVAVRPTDGCPGPETLDITESLRLIVLDTAWWLHPHDKPTHPDSPCPTDAMGEVTASLRDIVTSGVPVGVVAHHPLASGGIHGGHFGVLDHVFPLRALKSWLWLPLPIIGSAYPIARMSGISDQDLSGGGYRELNDSLRAAFADAPVLFYAGGHEHNLQVLADSTFGHMLVSGAGYFDHTSRAVYLDESRYAAATSGYMRVNVLRDGRVHLAVIVVDAAGAVSEALTMWLGNVRGD